MGNVTVKTDVDAMMRSMFADMSAEAVVVVQREAQSVAQEAVQSWPVGPGVPFHSRDAFSVLTDGTDVFVTNSSPYIEHIKLPGKDRRALFQWLVLPARRRLNELANVVRGLLVLAGNRG